MTSHNNRGSIPSSRRSLRVGGRAPLVFEASRGVGTDTKTFVSGQMASPTWRGEDSNPVCGLLSFGPEEGVLGSDLK
jgi:hypothetical protein